MEFSIENNMITAHVDNLIHQIPLEAIASWSELLGEPDPIEVLAHILNLSPQPEVIDPMTGENPWSEVSAILSYREQCREDEAVKAKREGKRDDPRSPLLRSKFAVRSALGVGENCMLKKCRGKTRSVLGVNDPKGNENDFEIMQTYDSQEIHKDNLSDVERAIRDQATYINKCKVEFLHSLTSHVENPLVEPEPVVDPTITQADILERYS